MSKKTKTLIGAGLSALLLATLLASSALAQGMAPWRSNGGSGYGMMGGRGMMQGNWNTMPGSQWGAGEAMPCGTNGGGFWSGSMMGGYGMMFGQSGARGATVPTGQPLTLDEAQAIAQQYLARAGNENLEIAEIMQFSDNFYVEVDEISTGIGAMELLINVYNGAVHPEPGPNMMWNTEYGHMGRGMMGGSFGRPSGEMTIAAAEAATIAQEWLDANMPGVLAGDEVKPFYGYYTIHTLTGGDISGMLSVNGYTGQVWYHNWHGDFVGMTGEHSE